MVASVGSNDKAEMYNYLGGVKNDKRSDALDVAFKQEKSNFHIAIVVDMWITGFDVPALTYMYNDKPLKKHMVLNFESGDKAGQDVKYNLTMCLNNGWIEVVD